MKLTIKKSELLKALSAASSVSSGRISPVLAFVKLDASKAGVSLTGTDLDCHYTRSTVAQVETPGSCLLPVAKVKEWLGIVGGGDVTMEFDGKQLRLSTPGSGLLKLSTYPVEEFPPESNHKSALVAVADFAPMKHISWAMIGSNEGRPELEAMFIEPENDGMICAATDGRKVATVAFAVKARNQEWKTGIALPSKYVSLVAGLGECELGESENSLHFTTEESKIVIRKSEHPAPNWRRATANPSFPVVGTVTVMRDEFAQAVAQCHLNRGSEEGSEYGVRVTLSEYLDAGVNVSCFIPKTGDSFSHVVDGRIKSEFPQVIIGSDHLVQFLGLPDESPLKIEFTGSKTMVKFNAPDVGVSLHVAPMFPEEKK